MVNLKSKSTVRNSVRKSVGGGYMGKGGGGTRVAPPN